MKESWFAGRDLGRREKRERGRVVEYHTEGWERGIEVVERWWVVWW